MKYLIAHTSFHFFCCNLCIHVLCTQRLRYNFGIQNCEKLDPVSYGNTPSDGLEKYLLK